MIGTTYRSTQALSANLFRLLVSANCANHSSLRANLRSLQTEPPVGVMAAPLETNIMLWNAVIFGCVRREHVVYVHVCVMQVTCLGVYVTVAMSREVSGPQGGLSLLFGVFLFAFD